MAGSYFLSGPLPLPGSGNTIKFTQFTSNDTWTKDANAQWVTCIIWNGGAGGGSGRRGASTEAGGGGGGAAGNVIIYSAPANMFGATEPITVGAGGAGGAAQTVNNTNGNPGSTVGTQSLVGNIGPVLTTFLGATLGGGGGTTTNSGAAPVGYITSSGVTLANGSSPYGANTISIMLNTFTAARGSNVGGESPTSLGVFSANTVNYFTGQYIPGYGAGGGGADSGTERAGGTGSSVLFADQTTMLAGGTAGLESTTINGGNGSDFVLPVAGAIFGGSGGGGGGGQSAGLVAGNGGNGGIPGAGGGGGGGSLNGTDSGTGGNGGRGEVWIYEILG